jgi:hypothetical protein
LANQIVYKAENLNMKLIVALITIVFSVQLYGQIGESIGSIKYDTELYKSPKKIKKVGVNSFDSTFHYISDTITLPIFDDFTIDYTQTYDANYGDANVTDTLFYCLLDSTTSLPLVDTSKFMLTPTYTVQVDTAGINDTMIENPSIPIKICFLNQYPPLCIDTVAWPRYTIYDTINFPSSPDTTWLIADVSQDSARLFFVTLSDPGYMWLDRDACHNFRFPENPWSQGVRTLDGVDENGMPYDLGNLNAYGIADYLTSKPIDLTSFNLSDSLLLSFVYQPKGLGNTPEEEDSLFVEFFQPDSMEWYRVWAIPGGFDTTEFIEARIMMNSSAFLKKGFQFRFGNYASLSGALDHWHLDYVRFRDNGGTDTNYIDIAIMYPNFTLLEEYTSIPWEHYKNSSTPNSLMIFDDTMNVRNTFSVASNQPTPNVGYIKVDYQGVNQWMQTLGVYGTGNWDPGTNDYVFPVQSAYTIDQALHDTTVTLDCEIVLGGIAVDNLYEINDTSRIQVKMENYYAYDDGSAEAAYGPTGSLAALAYKFEPIEADSLLGVYIGFVPSVTDVSGYEFLLTVWDDNNGEPGNVIYEDDPFDPRYPLYMWEKSGLRFYELQDSMKLFIDNTFYVGWKQYDSQRLNIGMDLNRDNSDKIFYSINNQNTWQNTVFEGSLLMRPVFDTDMNHVLGYKEQVKIEEFDFVLYPNPTNNLVNIKGDIEEIERIDIFDLTGKLVNSYRKNYSIDVTFLNHGIYLMRIVDKNGINYNHKFIKN